MQLKLFLLITLSFLFTSCFEVIEEISINEDGSGTFELTFNLSESKTKLSSIMLLDSIEGFNVPSKGDISQTILQLVSQAQNTEGIKNVDHKMDFENFIFSLSCDFNAVESLNEVVSTIGQSYGMNKEISPDAQHVSFDPISKVFIRNGNYLTASEYNKMNSRGKEVMQQSKFISINRFANEIAEAQNSQTKISPNKKASMLKLTLSDVLTGKVSVGNELRLK